MKKGRLALAIVAACGAPAGAMADDATVQIYGVMHATLENVKATGATAGSAQDLPSRNRVSSNLSHVGFRGTEPLGGGTNAFFQVESNAPLDNGTGTWASRNSAVGLNGNFGSVLLGTWDTPFKLASGRTDPWGNNIGDAASMFHNTGVVTGNNACTNVAPGGVSVSRGSFHRRQQNSVQYWTPQLGGFFSRLAYSANEERTPTCNPGLYSLSVGYDVAPLYVAAAYEQHNNYGGQGLDDKAWEIAATYTIGGFTFGAAYEMLKYEFAGGLETKVPAAFLSLVYKYGQHFIRTYVQKAYDPRGNGGAVGGAGAGGTDGGARQFVFGYGYTLSKRTEVYGIYSRIQNDPTASYDFGTNSIGGITGQTAKAGVDPTGFAIGIKHVF